MSKLNQQDLKNIAQRARIEVLKMIYQAGSGHLGGSFSIMEMLVALYFGNILKFDPKNPDWSERDYFLLSNGHTCPALYAILAYAGFFQKNRLKTLRQLDSGLEGHPRKNSLPGIEISSGSLGMGLSQAIGIALGLKLLKKPNQVIVMTSDGEQDEGSVWEAVMAAAHFKLNNLTAIIDRNQVQIGGFTERQMALEPLTEKYLSFNWQVIEVNGHSFSAILKAFARTRKSQAPSVIISHTQGAKGVSFVEGRADTHKIKVDEQFYQKALKSLKKIKKPLK